MNAIRTTVALLLFGATPALAAGDSVRGEAVFIEICAPCHFEFKAMGNNVGPNLSSVIGREAGTFTGYDYSDAMKAQDHEWTDDMLTRYLSGPKDMVPGVRMRFDGFDDPAKIADVIAYLKSIQGK